MSALDAIGHAWVWYWREALGNVLAVGPCAVVAGVPAWLLRARIGLALVRWLDKHHARHRAELAEQKQASGHDNAVH